MTPLEQALRAIFRELKGVVLDIGCGTGRNIELLKRASPRLTHVIGLDVDIVRLKKALKLISSEMASLICSSASALPLRSRSVDTVITTLMFHELSEELVDPTLREVLRVLKEEGEFIVVDKIAFKPSSPSEELTLLTEETYHRALLYAKGIKTWGLRKERELIEKVSTKGFKLSSKLRVRGKALKPEEFLNMWGKETLNLLSEVNDTERKREIEGLVDRIKYVASRHGYGPSRILIAIFRKQA